MSPELVLALDAIFSEDPVLVAGAPDGGSVNALEAFVPFSLPDSYLEFVRRYGAGIVGPYPIFGIGASEAMGRGDASAIDATLRYREQRWPGTDGALVISADHAGNAITLDRAGAVRRFDHDSAVAETLAASFEEFALRWCLKA